VLGRGTVKLRDSFEAQVSFEIDKVSVSYSFITRNKKFKCAKH
jgi:hypothetical protein